MKVKKFFNFFQKCKKIYIYAYNVMTQSNKNNDKVAFNRQSHSKFTKNNIEN